MRLFILASVLPAVDDRQLSLYVEKQFRQNAKHLIPQPNNIRIPTQNQNVEV